MLALGRGFFAVAALVAMALMVPAGASAAAPANDNFADREVLSGSLPIEVTRSNDEATKEVGESLGYFAAAGRSVWFEWEATVSGWVTVGACDADFSGFIGVYTGAAPNALTKVPSGSGPFCSQRQFTFKAEAGTEYLFAVDGDGFYFPGNPLPDTEGTFTLRIEQTPAPANDDFADATLIETPFFQSFEGDDLYIGTSQGYNWNATRETGEPAHSGGPNDASVWFSWTPPVTGSARITSCCAPGFGMAMYRGAAFGSLETLFAGVAQGIGSGQAMVIGGTTYRIAIYGLLDGGVPATGSFPIHIDLRRPTPPSPPAITLPELDVKAPQTTIRKRAVKPHKGKAEFRFASSEAGGSFRCRLDGKPLRTCNSPVRFANLGSGKHVFKVFAVDPAGNADPSPALARFKIFESAAG